MADNARGCYSSCGKSSHMNNLDDRTIYVFVRGDLPQQDQVLQLCHAVFKMTALLTPGFGDVKVVELDCGISEKSFNNALRRVEEAQLAHAEYSDSDVPQWGITAIATAPLTKEQSLPLANYRLKRRYSPPAEASAVVDSKSSGEPGSHSSEKEHSVFNGEVAGSIPAVSSNLNCS